MECVKCHRPGGEGLLCAACGAVLPARQVDPFAALGLGRTFALELGDVERSFRELSKKLHPDRFAKAEPRERALSAQATTTLNESYRVLRDPVRRAEALLALSGLTIGDNEPVDPAFLQEMLELREELEDANDAAKARLGADVAARKRASLDAIAKLFARGDREALAEIKAQLIALRYYHRFLEAHAQDEDGDED